MKENAKLLLKDTAFAIAIAFGLILCLFIYDYSHSLNSFSEILYDAAEALIFGTFFAPFGGFGLAYSIPYLLIIFYLYYLIAKKAPKAFRKYYLILLVLAWCIFGWYFSLSYAG